MATNGAEIVASELMVALLTGVDVTVPTINTADSEFQIPGDNTSDAYDVLLKLTNADLTTGAINGTGSFDKLMVGVAAQLQGEYDAGRITGAEYSKAYITLTQSALATSLQFLLGKDASYWQAVQAQTQAVIARVQLATVKAENARAQIEALTAKSNYALTKLKLATEDVQYGSLKYKLDNIDPLQVTQLTLQNSGITTSNLGLGINNSIASYNLSTTLPKQSLMLDAQLAQTTAQTAGITASNTGIGISNDIASYNLATTLPKQALLLDGQSSNLTAQTNHIVKQQLNTEAQTLQVTAQTDGVTKTNVGIDTANSIASYNLTTVLPAQLAMTNSQKIGQDKQNDTAIYNLENLLPAQLATASSQKLSIDKANSISDYNLATVLPSQVAMTNAQKLGQDKQTETANYNLINLLPKQVDLLDEQIAGAVKDTETKTYTLDEIMPVQKLNLQEQAEAQRAQTMDTRSNGVTAVTGSIGKQNALYAQQIISYQKDSQLKAGKIFSDIWTVQKTVDEHPNVPDAFGYQTINSVMQKIITSNGLV